MKVSILFEYHRLGYHNIYQSTENSHFFEISTAKIRIYSIKLKRLEPFETKSFDKGKLFSAYGCHSNSVKLSRITTGKNVIKNM